jgi:hypothetical protein
MIRGYRWGRRDGQWYLTRRADGREVATVYSTTSAYCWQVRGRFSAEARCGFCDRLDDAKRAAEAEVKRAATASSTPTTLA